MNSKSIIISASEIGQYHYCSIAWYLQKCGYKPKSQSLEIGLEKHKKLGETLDQVHKNLIKSKITAFFGYTILFFSLLILIFEVIS